MRTPVLILPVKGQILRTWRGGKKWQNFADVLYGWPLTNLYYLVNFHNTVSGFNVFCEANLYSTYFIANNYQLINLIKKYFTIVWPLTAGALYSS